MKVEFGFNVFLDPAFLFIEVIWHDVQKGYGFILSSISCRTFAVSPAINDMVNLCPSLWCKNSEATLFLGAISFDLDFSFVFSKNACLLCALCDRVTAYSFSSPNYTIQTPLQNKQGCTKLTNVIIKNNLSHISGAISTLCNVTMKGFLSSLHIFILTFPFASPCRNVHPQLQFICPYILMKLG